MKYLFVLILFPITLHSSCWGQDKLLNNGNLEMHPGSKMAVFGDVENNASFTCNPDTISLSSEFHLLGSLQQNITGTMPLVTANVVLNNAANIKLDNVLEIRGQMTFTAGSIISDRADIATEYVHFNNGASYVGASSSRFVDGVVRKTGKQSFEFPVGQNGALRYIGMSAPANRNESFVAYYKSGNPLADGYDVGAKDVTINHLSTSEYWILNSVASTSSLYVTLSYNSGSMVTNQSDLLVTKWNGSTWKDLGNSSITGTTNSGTVTSSVMVSSFSPFTLASISSANPLPIEMLSFEALALTDSVVLNWATASEKNSNYFIVQRAYDAINWENIATISAHGNSKAINKYQTYDLQVLPNTSYYRLKQVDYNGGFVFSEIKSVNFPSKSDNGQCNVYPNPATVFISIDLHNGDGGTICLFNTIGQCIKTNNFDAATKQTKMQFDIGALTNGIYKVSVTYNNGTTESNNILIYN